MVVRTLNIENFDQIINLWQRAGLSTRPKGRDSFESIEVEMKFNPGGFIGLFDGDNLIGLILATFDGRKGWINRLAIDPDFRRRGLALKLIGEAESHLKTRGAKIIASLIEDWNESSFKLFDKAGYVTHRSIIYTTKRKSDDI